MSKRIISLVLILIMCISTFSVEIYAKENKAYKVYQEAIQVTTSSGSWTEYCTMTANMNISKGNAKLKTKVTMTTNMDISDYSASDLSGTKVSGTADLSVMGQKYAFNIQYENGIAHYEYTEPYHTTSDIEIDLPSFAFMSIASDMMTKAKVSGNKISFTIPGNKMQEDVIAAIELMPDVKNLKYDDIDVEILIDKKTGKIEKIIITFHASLTYQGYDTECDYHIDYAFISNGNDMIEPIEDDILEMKIEDGIIIYSDYQNLSIRKDSILTLGAGIIIDGKQIDDVSGITFWTDNSSILKTSNTKIKNKRRYVEFKGIDTGITYVYFSDSNTGYIAKVPVTVYENNYLSYTLNSVPTQYIEKYPTNIYNANGLYVDSYSYSINNNGTAKVSFDVYNTNYTYGVVEVYNENGNLKDAVLINKMNTNNTSIKEALWENTGCLIRDMIDKDFLSYRQESGFSKKTPVNIEIPKNGYIKICNDPENSAIVNIINSVDVLMSLGELANKVKNYDANEEVFCEKLTSKLVKEKVFEKLVKDGSDLQEDLWKGVAKEVLFSTESLGDFCNTMVKNLDKFDLGKLIADTAKDFGWNVGEEVFKYFTGPIKMIFDGLFLFGKLENIIIQHTDLIQSSGLGSIYIQNQGGGVRSVQQIKVQSNTGFSEDTSLNVFKVTLDSTVLDALKKINPEVYEEIVNETSYTYNISLLKNGRETQPDEKVTVYIPIPKDLKLLAYAGKAKVYRVEDDGNVTEMDVKIKDGCFVFSTTHFSFYTLVGNNLIVIQNIVIAVSGVIILILILFLLLKIKKRKNQYTD